MSVHLSLDESQKTDKDGKPYRHFLATCSVLKESGQKVKNNVPNTKALQARTVRCPNPSHDEKTGCWEVYEDMIKAKKSKSGATIRTPKGAKQPAKQQGGKAGSIAAKAAAARKAKDAKPAEKAEEKKEPAEVVSA